MNSLQKVLAESGDLKAQFDWLSDELQEFDKALKKIGQEADKAPAHFSKHALDSRRALVLDEMFDVIGCFVKFNITSADFSSYFSPAGAEPGPELKMMDRVLEYYFVLKNTGMFRKAYQTWRDKQSSRGRATLKYDEFMSRAELILTNF